MCVVGVKSHKQKELHDLMLEMAPIMSERDQDGLGYMALTSKGMYGERWFDPKDAFKDRSGWVNIQENNSKLFEGEIESTPFYLPFKQNNEAATEPKQAVIMHTRWATCEKAMKNVHPFYRDGVALIHNGVISNVNQLKQLTSTCDSEGILNSYVDNSVSTIPDNISKVGNFLKGSYTCGVLTRDANGVGVLDLFRSSPNLSTCFIPELDAIVFVTAEHMLSQACRNLGWKHSAFMKLKEDGMVRINAETGEHMSKHLFSSSNGLGSYYEGAYDNGYQRNRKDGNFNTETHRWEYPTSVSSITTNSNPKTAQELVDQETERMLQSQIEEVRSNIINIRNDSQKKSQQPSAHKMKEMSILRQRGIPTTGQVIGVKQTGTTGN